MARTRKAEAQRLLFEAARDAVGEAAMMEGDLDSIGQPLSRRGEVYQLGPHRLMCGDSILVEDVAELWRGERADAILTDPPYCSGGYQEAGRNAGSKGTTSDDPERIARDHLTTFGLEILIEKAIGRVPGGGCCYVFTDWRQWETIRRACEPLGYSFRSMLVWDKITPGMGGPWRHQYELVYFGSRRRESAWGRLGDLLHHHGGDLLPDRSSPEGVIAMLRELLETPEGVEVARLALKLVGEDGPEAWGMLGDVLPAARTGNKWHATEKPVPLLVDILRNTDGEVVGEPFSGSGGTILACSETGKVCRAMELDPRNCDAARRRWGRYARARSLEVGDGF